MRKLWKNVKRNYAPMMPPINAEGAVANEYIKIKKDGDRAAACAAFTKYIKAADAVEAVMARLPSYCRFGAGPYDRKGDIKANGPPGWPNCMNNNPPPDFDRAPESRLRLRTPS